MYKILLIVTVAYEFVEFNFNIFYYKKGNENRKNFAYIYAAFYIFSE